MDRLREERRAVSPVVGSVLLLAVVVVLGAVGGSMFLGMTQETDPAPSVVLDVEPADDGAVHVLRHDGGAELEGERLVLRGAVDPDGLAGATLAAGRGESFYPVEPEVTVVWTGDRGTSYTLGTFAVEDPLPAPDRGCGWVDDETDGGADPAKVHGVVVNCDVETTEIVEVQDGGVIIGDAISGEKGLDGDDSTVYGDVDVERVANLQNGTVTGSTTSRTSDVKLYNSTVEGPVAGHRVVEVERGSTVDGDVVSHNRTVEVDSSAVSGSITADESVDLQDARVEGDVYVDPSDFGCTDSTVNGRSCSDYEPKDPDDW